MAKSWIDGVEPVLAFKIISMITILGLALICSFLPLKVTSRPRLLSILNIAGGGVFLATGLVHLLSSANESFSSYSYPFAFFFTGVGFLLTLSVEEFVMYLSRSQSGHHHAHGVSVVVSEASGAQSVVFLPQSRPPGSTVLQPLTPRPFSPRTPLQVSRSTTRRDSLPPKQSSRATESSRSLALDEVIELVDPHFPRTAQVTSTNPTTSTPSSVPSNVKRSVGQVDGISTVLQSQDNEGKQPPSLSSSEPQQSRPQVMSSNPRDTVNMVGSGSGSNVGHDRIEPATNQNVYHTEATPITQSIRSVGGSTDGYPSYGTADNRYGDGGENDDNSDTKSDSNISCHSVLSRTGAGRVDTALQQTLVQCPDDECVAVAIAGGSTCGGQICLDSSNSVILSGPGALTVALSEQSRSRSLSVVKLSLAADVDDTGSSSSSGGEGPSSIAGHETKALYKSNSIPVSPDLETDVTLGLPRQVRDELSMATFALLRTHYINFVHSHVPGAVCIGGPGPSVAGGVAHLKAHSRQIQLQGLRGPSNQDSDITDVIAYNDYNSAHSNHQRSLLSENDNRARNPPNPSPLSTSTPVLGRDRRESNDDESFHLVESTMPSSTTHTHGDPRRSISPQPSPSSVRSTRTPSLSVGERKDGSGGGVVNRRGRFGEGHPEKYSEQTRSRHHDHELTKEHASNGDEGGKDPSCSHSHAHGHTHVSLAVEDAHVHAHGYDVIGQSTSNIAAVILWVRWVTSPPMYLSFFSFYLCFPFPNLDFSSCYSYPPISSPFPYPYLSPLFDCRLHCRSIVSWKASLLVQHLMLKSQFLLLLSLTKVHRYSILHYILLSRLDLLPF